MGGSRGADWTGDTAGLLRKTGTEEKQRRKEERRGEEGETFREQRTSAEEPEIEREAGLDLLTRDFLLVQVQF